MAVDDLLENGREAAASRAFDDDDLNPPIAGRAGRFGFGVDRILIAASHYLHAVLADPLAHEFGSHRIGAVERKLVVDQAIMHRIGGAHAAGVADDSEPAAGLLLNLRDTLQHFAVLLLQPCGAVIEIDNADRKSTRLNSSH